MNLFFYKRFCQTPGICSGLVSGFLFLITLFFAGEVFSQIPTPAEPDRFDSRFKPPEQPRATEEPIVPESRDTLPPSELGLIKFVLKGVHLTGVKTYSKKELGQFYDHYMGKQVSLLKIYEIAGQITAKYRSDGYILSRAVVSKQKIRHGIVRIRVVEGFIDEVEIKGNHWDFTNLIKTYSDRIIQSRPLQSTTLERYLLLIDDLPGVKVQSILTPSKLNFGASKMTLITKHQIVDAFVSMDNRGSDYNGPMQFTMGGNLNNAFGLYERTGFRFIMTLGDNELQYFSAHHDQRIGPFGTRVFLFGSRSNTNPGLTLKPLEVKGDTATISGFIQQPFIRSRGMNLYGRVGMTGRDSETQVLGLVLNTDRVRVVNVGFTFDWVDSFKGVSLISFDYNQGINVFNARETGSLFLTRIDGESEFSKFYGRFLRMQQIIPRWNLLFETVWQYSLDNLLASEEFAIGGPRFGRAYDPSEYTGENGVAAKAELQFAIPVGWKYLKNLQLYGFADYGAIWNYDPDISSQQKFMDIISTGVGIRVNFTDNISGYIEGVRPIDEVVQSEGTQNDRVFFSINARY